MRAATEGNLPPVMPQGNLVGVLGREVRQGLPGELMVENSPSHQRRSPCRTNKEMSDEAADAAALTYLTYHLPPPVPVSWPLLWPGSSPGGEGVVVGCAAVFSASSSVGVAPSPFVGVPSFPCVVTGGRWASAGVVRTALDSCFGGVCWGRAPLGVARCPLGVGPRWSLCCGMPFLRVRRCPPLLPLSLRHSPCSFPVLAHGWFPAPMLCRSRCPVSVGTCLSPRALPCPLAGVSLPVPCPPLARALSLPSAVVVGWGGGLWGADGPHL